MAATFGTLSFFQSCKEHPCSAIPATLPSIPISKTMLAQAFQTQPGGAGSPCPCSMFRDAQLGMQPTRTTRCCQDGAVSLVWGAWCAVVAAVQAPCASGPRLQGSSAWPLDRSAPATAARRTTAGPPAVQCPGRGGLPEALTCQHSRSMGKHWCSKGAAPHPVPSFPRACSPLPNSTHKHAHPPPPRHHKLCLPPRAW